MYLTGYVYPTSYELAPPWRFERRKAMAVKTRPFDAAAYLDSDAAIAAYMTEALETNDAKLIARALGAVARARGMSDVARSAGVSRESLYRALSAEGNPELGTVLRVLSAFNIRLSAVPQSARPRRRAAGTARQELVTGIASGR